MARGYRAVLELGEREDALRGSLIGFSMSGCTTSIRCGRRARKPHVTTRASTDSALFYHREGSTWTSS